MRFHILGIGPIGSLLAFHLRRTLPPSHAVALIHKTQRQANEITGNGGAIRVEIGGVVISADGFESEIFEAPTAENLKTIRTPRNDDASVSNPVERPLQENTAPPDTIESLFVTTKAHQTLSAIERLLPRLSGDSTIVLLQNGMGIYEQLVQDIFRNPAKRPHFILASNTHGAWFKRFHHVVHTGVGQIHFGIVPDTDGRQFEAALSDNNVPRHEQQLRLDDIAKLSGDPLLSRYRSLRSTVAALCSMEEGFRTSWRPIAQVQESMRRKLVVNAVINPLTALMGCRNGDIFTTAAAHRVMRRVCQEAADAFAAQIKADTQAWLDENREGLPIGRIPRSLTRPLLEEECLRVAELTKGNISSMLSDIRRGRNTEIDFVNGYLLNLGATYGVPMPATATLLNLVKMRSAIPLEQQL